MGQSGGSPLPSSEVTRELAQVVAEAFRQVGTLSGMSTLSPRSPFEPSVSDSIEMRWKKKLQRSLSLREYFWPPQWARSRLDKLIQNAGKGITKPSTVSLAGEVSVQVGAGDDSVEVGNSPMDFLDGFEYACRLMVEMDFDPLEIASRREFVRWLFWHPYLSDKARMCCAEEFLIRYHAHLNWMSASKEESFIWMKGMAMSHVSSSSKSGGKPSPKRAAKKRKGDNKQQQQSSSRGKSFSRSKDSSEKDKPASRATPEGRISGVCDSRVQKNITCRFERNGGDGSECMFSHTCPRCPGVNHSAAHCGKL